MKKDDIIIYIQVILITIAFFLGIAFAVFQARNPKANNMTFYTEFKSVIIFEKLEKYQ